MCLMQIVEILIRRCNLRRLIWVCAVYQCPIHGTVGINGVSLKCFVTTFMTLSNNRKISVKRTQIFVHFRIIPSQDFLGITQFRVRTALYREALQSSCLGTKGMFCHPNVKKNYSAFFSNFCSTLVTSACFRNSGL